MLFDILPPLFTLEQQHEHRLCLFFRDMNNLYIQWWPSGIHVLVVKIKRNLGLEVNICVWYRRVSSRVIGISVYGGAYDWVWDLGFMNGVGLRWGF